jgi:hypothetical protein
VLQPSGVAQVGEEQSGPDGDAGERALQGQEMAAGRGEAQHQEGEAEAGQEKAETVEGRRVRLADVGMNNVASPMPRSPIGMLMKKIQRQSKAVVMKPPRGGPTTGPTMAGIVR